MVVGGWIMHKGSGLKFDSYKPIRNTQQCWSSDHVWYLVPAYISLVFYVIGIPVSSLHKIGKVAKALCHITTDECDLTAV